jgi:hypothetical protein
MDKKKSHPLTILPIKKNKTSEEFPHIMRPLPVPPFSMCFVSPTKSGKTSIIMNLLMNPMFGYCNDVFDEIYFISPTVEIDPNLRHIKEDDDIIKISDEDDLKNLDTILEDIVHSQKIKSDEDRKHILVVLDDCMPYLKTSKKLNSLNSYSRHFKISFMVSSQVYNAIPVRFRSNCSAYVLSKIFNNKDLTNIENELGCNYFDFRKYYDEATKEKFNFLFIDNKEIELWRNFTDKMWAKY